MSTAPPLPATDTHVPGPPASGSSAAVRFVTAFGATLLPLVAAVVALELAWSSSAAGTWPAAGAVVTGWALATAGWLHCRGWAAGAVLAVLAAPAAVLAAAAAAGWLTPAGLVLWGPVSTVLAAALAMAASPPIRPPPAPDRPEEFPMTTQRIARPRPGRVGLLAGLLAAAAGEITASATRRGRSPSSGLARGLVDAAPAVLVDGGVALVGRADKPGLAVLAAGASGLAAATGGSLAGRRPVLGAAVAALPHALDGCLALRRGDASARDTGVATAAGTLIAAGAVVPLPVRPPAVLAAAAAATGAVVAVDRRARRRGAAALRDRVRLPAPTGSESAGLSFRPLTYDLVHG